jgi:hypothetical protein
MYINAHAEELRSQFVAHKDKKKLVVPISGKIGNLGFEEFAQNMVEEMQKNILDENLKDRVIPDFSTTTTTDKVVASVAFMGAMSKYFDFGGSTGCGLPSVNLLGAKNDWETILQKLEKIPELGEEPKQWYRLLAPLLKRFVRTFDRPSSNDTKDFWGKILHLRRGGSGQPDHYSGWLNVFSFWNDKGKCLFDEGGERTCAVPRERGHEAQLTLDGERFHRLRTKDIVKGWVSVDVEVDDTYNRNGIYMVQMVAGSVGLEFESSGDHSEHEHGLDTVQAITGWWAYERMERLLVAAQSQMTSSMRVKE